MAKLLYRSSLTPPMPEAVATESAVKGTPLSLLEGDYNFKALNDEIATKASLVSPTFAGTPTAPTASPGTNNTQVATTEFVTAAIESSPGGIEYGRVIAPVTLVDKQGVLADTTAGSFTITLPSSPVIGTQSFVADGGDWSINNLIIDPNGQQIESLSVDENLILDIGGASIQFVFDGVIWRVFSTLTTGAITGDLLASVLSSAPSKTAPNDNDKTNLIDSEDAWSLKSLTFANLKAWIGSLFVSKSGDTMTGDLNFSGAGRRITGNFSDATIANRLLFQSNVTNGTTAVFAIPNGSEVISNFSAVNKSDPANAAIAQMAALGGEVRFSSFASGTGTVVPMTFHVGAGGERLRIDTNGNVGFGTSTPSVKMQVRSLTACQLYVTEDSTGITAQMSASAGGAIYGSFTNDPVQIRTNNVERIRIDTSGGVGIGKSADTGVKLDVLGQFQLASGADGGIQRFKYTTQNAASRSWRMANDVSAFGDFRLQRTTTQTGSTFTDVLSVNETSGAVLIHSGVLGYGVGSGGSVTQATSKATPVTLNKPSGIITMHDDAIAPGAFVTFQLNNSFISGNELIMVQPSGGGGGHEYQAWVSYTAGGVCLINVRNNGAASLAQAIPIRFAIYKVATS